MVLLSQWKNSDSIVSSYATHKHFLRDMENQSLTRAKDIKMYRKTPIQFPSQPSIKWFNLGFLRFFPIFILNYHIRRKQLTLPALVAISLPKSSHSNNLCRSVTLRILFSSQTDKLSLRNLALSSLCSVPSIIIWNISDS